MPVPETSAARLHQQQQAVASLFQAALDGQPLAGLLDEAARTAAPLVGAPMVSVFRREGARVRLVAGAGWPAGTVGTLTLPAGAGTASGIVLDAAGPVAVPDVAAHPLAASSLLAEQGVASCVCAPIRTAPEVTFGLLGFYATTPGAFSPADETFARLLALVLAVAARGADAGHTGDPDATLEARVQQQTARARALLADLLEAERRERRHVAQALQDDLQQLLYGLQLRVDLLTRALPPDEAPSAEAASGLLGKAIHTARVLTLDLTPPVLPGEGLDRAVEWLAIRLHDAHGLRTTVRADGDTRAAPDIQTLLVQTVRSLLLNVVHHAGCGTADVCIARRNSAIVVDVTDTGVGFDAAAALGTASSRSELPRARERLRLVGGTLNVMSQLGAGTTVRISTPAQV